MDTKHTCTRCPICRGDGNMYQDGWGSLSPVAFEDTDEPVTCDYCEGSGRVGHCQRCWELEIEEEELH